MLPPTDRLNRRLLLRSPEPSSGGIVLRTYTALKDLHSHKWMYDANSPIIHFQQTGFAKVRGNEIPRKPHSGDPRHRTGKPRAERRGYLYRGGLNRRSCLGKAPVM
jgi:hypothetical protein